MRTADDGAEQRAPFTVKRSVVRNGAHAAAFIVERDAIGCSRTGRTATRVATSLGTALEREA